jgi:triosephosphate isomerase
MTSVRTRRPLLAGNWKMHGARTEAVALAAALAQAVGQADDRDVLVAPPFTALEAVAQAIRGTRLLLAAQNVHWEARGAFTGEISTQMLREAACTHVIVGHSERRQLFGETDATVNRRLRAALTAGLVPIACIGETLDEREAGTTMAVVERQVRGAFDGVAAEQLGTCIVAYEPVWAIGTGRTATPAQAQDVHAAIRGLLAALTGPAVAERVRILYGGSVKSDNIDSLMACPDIDGALVGGASLVAEQFIRIVRFEEPA